VTQFAQNAGLLRRGQGSAVTLAMAAQCISSGASANKIKRQQEHQQSEIEGKKRSRKQKNIWRRPHFGKRGVGWWVVGGATLTCFATFGCHHPLDFCHPPARCHCLSVDTWRPLPLPLSAFCHCLHLARIFFALFSLVVFLLFLQHPARRNKKI